MLFRLFYTQNIRVLWDKKERFERYKFGEVTSFCHKIKL